MKRHVLPILGLMAGLVLASACTTANTPTPETGGYPAPAIETPGALPEQPPEAVLNAQTWLAGQLNLPAENLVIAEMNSAEWTDGCLGLGGPAESCVQVITPGWQLVFTVNGQDYAVRTDANGTQVRLETGPLPYPAVETPAGS